MNTETIDVLLTQHGHRQRVADTLLGRSRTDRLLRWLPSLGLVALIAWDASHGAERSAYGLFIMIAVVNVVSLALAQGQATRRINAIAMVLERSGTLEAFLTSGPRITRPSDRTERP